MKNLTEIEATYGGLVDVCNKFGISRTVAFELAAKGLIEVFRIGTRRMVFVESVKTLPDRLAERGGKK